MHNREFPNSELNIPINRPLRWISIFGIVFFLWMAFLSKLNEAGVGYILTFIGFSFLELFGLLLSFSTMQVNRKSVATTMLSMKYRIDWDEVKTIETDIASIVDAKDPLDETDWDIGSTIVFLGNEKCFPVKLTGLGKGKADFLRFVEELIVEHQIQVKPLSSPWMRHKNTKVKGSES